MWPEVIRHAHLGEPRADLNHRIDEHVGKGLIFVESLNGFFQEIQADSGLVIQPSEQVGRQAIMLRVCLATTQIP